MNQHPRRPRSPPYGYDPRGMMANNRSEFEGPYHPNNPMHGPPQSGSLLPSAGPPLFVDSPPSYSMNYRDLHRLPSTYRATLTQRDSSYPQILNQSPQEHPSRAQSPPYKILCITNINPKISDGPVKEALTTDFGRFGDVSVSICHDNGERLAYIYFRNFIEAREARLSKMGALLFDRPIDIEPIFEQRGGADSPIESSPPIAMAPSMPLMYSPGQRSVTPPEFAQDLTGPMQHHRRHPMPHPMQHGPMQPMIHDPESPVMHEYPSHHLVYSHESSPPYGPPVPVGQPAYDRRSYANAGHPQYSQGHHSPYSSPPHDPYRSPYPHHHSSDHYNMASNYASYPAYGGAGPPPMVRGERERIYSDNNHHSISRSPRNDYIGSERAGLATLPSPRSSHHSSATSYYSGGYNVSHSSHQYQHPSPSYRSPNNSTSHHNSQPDPPMRYLSREFRREKLGIDHGTDSDDGRPSRVLLINNIDSAKTESDLRETFSPFGIIEEMEVRGVAPGNTSALIKFSSMDGAYKAKTAINGRHIGNTRCRIVYGKASASRRLWIGGLSPTTTVPGLEDECGKFGDLANLEYTSGRPYAYVEYISANQAQFAAHHLKTTLTPASERKIRIEFVDPERSEKLVPKGGASTETISRHRSSTEYWTEKDRINHSSLRKRSASPPDQTVFSKKRPCEEIDIPVGSNTFKQERLAAAAAAKARTSSSASSIASHAPSNDDNDKNNLVSDVVEPNNNLRCESSTNSNATGDNHCNEERPNRHIVHDAPGEKTLAECTTIGDILQSCPVQWSSQLALRNFTFPARIHLCSGRKHIVERYLNGSCVPEDGDSQLIAPLKITQRWRLHPQPKLEEVKRRMQSGNHGILIITARPVASAINRSHSSTNGDRNVPPENDEDGSNRNEDHKSIHPEGLTSNSIDKNSSGLTEGGGSNYASSPNSSMQARPLRNLISYLEQKDAAGVISLNALDGGGSQTPVSEGGGQKLLYTFPPCDFALDLLRCKATGLSPSCTKEEFLLGVIIGGIDTSKL